MEFYFKSKGAKLHLYLVEGLFDKDLGELTEASSGRFKTKNLFGENYELRDISGLFKKGDKYEIKNTDGLSGILEKKPFSHKYEFK